MTFIYVTSIKQLRHAQHLVFVPTDRDCVRAIESTIDEISALNSDLAGLASLLLIDSGPAQRTRRNREVLRYLSDTVRGDVLYMDDPAWGSVRDEICGAVSARDRQRARELLTFNYPSYGAGPIKAALIACAVGSTTLHRRDSDQVVSGPPGAAPLALEIEILGMEESRLFKDGSAQSIIRAVGSSLTGEASRDRRDLDYVDPGLGVRLDAAHGGTGKKALRTASSYLRADGVAIRRDLHGTVEMGICGLRDVFRWIPEMPASRVFGVDYMQKNLLYQLGDAVIHHDRTAHHSYEPARLAQSSAAAIRGYVLAELRYAYIRPIWNEANRLIANSGPLQREGTVVASAYGSAWRLALEEYFHRAASVHRAYLDVYRSAVAGARDGAHSTRLHWRLDALTQWGVAAMGESHRAVLDFLDLVDRWQELCAVASAGRNE